MRKLAPALVGRVTRRSIVHSPHTWNATAATFVIFAITDLIVSFTIPSFDADRLYMLAAGVGAVGVMVFFTRPPERGSVWTHLLVAAVYCGVSFAVFAHAPQGSAPLVTGMFIPVLAALWIPDRRHAAAHLALACALLLGAALSGGNDDQTIAAVLCFLPALIALYAVTTVVLDALDAQAAVLDDLALRDPLTGAGNQRLLDGELAAELTRHRSAGRQLTVVDVGIDRFGDVLERIGSAASDAVLLAVSRALHALAPTGATVARVAGDHFTVLLPNTGTEAAAAFADGVGQALPAHVGGGALGLTAGTATYPEDAVDAATLLDIAARRRGSSPVRTPASADSADEATPWQVMVGGFDAAAAPQLPRRVRRVDIAADRWIWRAIGLGIAVYCLVSAAAWALIDDFAAAWFPMAAAAGALGGASLLVTRPARIESPWNHAVVAMGYVLPVTALIAAAPNASWAAATGLLSPLLITARLTDRRQIGAHLIALTVLLTVASIVCRVDAPTIVGVLALVTNSWILGGCTVVVFEAAERQSSEIASLLVRDPLTGAGNRRLLLDRLEEEVARHATLQLPLVFVDLELREFDSLVHEHGRRAANTLLRETAAAADRIAGPGATVARVTGGRFWLLLPLTGLDEPDRLRDFHESEGLTADRLAADLTEAIEELAGDVDIAVDIGIAQYPEDAVNADGLVALADHRRRPAAIAPVGLAIVPDPGLSTPQLRRRAG